MTLIRRWKKKVRFMPCAVSREKPFSSRNPARYESIYRAD
jgi:hypothetical protein